MFHIAGFAIFMAIIIGATAMVRWLEAPITSVITFAESEREAPTKRTSAN